MLRIKRTKQGPPTVQAKDGKRVDIPGPVATHYATAVSPNGSIGGWSANPDQAVAVTEGVAKRVRDYYAGQPRVGELSLEPIKATGAMLAEAVAAEDGVGAAEFAALQEENKRLRAENQQLDKEMQEDAVDNIAAAQREKEATAKAKALEADLIAKSEDNARLAARVAELEALLASATEPAKPPEPPAEKPPEPEKPGRKAK